MDFCHLIVTCLFSMLRLPFDNQKVKGNYAIFLRNITIFLENIKVFFAAWECAKTKPTYPIVSCRGEVRSPENSLLCIFGQVNPAPTNETTVLSTF